MHMDEFLEYSWLIPVIPFLVASLLGILLVSFDRTMNRLSKPVFAISLGSTSLSALLSYFLLFYEFNHQNIPYVFDLDHTLCDVRKIAEENNRWGYEQAEPYFERIKQVNELYNTGNQIIIDSNSG